ncbi:hotdog fold thioesterase [Nocardiopsis tropica]|uniref:Hotdog fold thioesterase n=1 Tax=Nocardiopsis tropica TaxID=109330 RepID=A0ABU7KIQ5_9ACTN|nr:hotdog fold thioesterase [Nocardiopsis umidischolae]MEE2049174.1 hotdog fold thioesterase [Nocardiopsis umidischolae]
MEETLETFLSANVLGRRNLIQRMGINIHACRSGYVAGSMPVLGNHQPLGILHGGASAVLAETLGSLAAFLHAGEGGNAVGVDLSCTHHRWVSSGEVTGVCTPLHESSSSATYEIVISDDTGRRTCTARITCAIRRRRRAGQ